MIIVDGSSALRYSQHVTHDVPTLLGLTQRRFSFMTLQMTAKLLSHFRLTKFYGLFIQAKHSLTRRVRD